jgi:hypothetical protein
MLNATESGGCDFLGRDLGLKRALLLALGAVGLYAGG